MYACRVSKKNLVVNSSNFGSKLLLILASLITLYFNPGFADPFNSAKLYLLMLATVILLGYFWTKNIVQSQEIKLTKTLKNILIIFILLYVAASFLSANKYKAFLGEYQRQTGLIAYLCFAVFMYLSAAKSNFIELSKIVNTFAFLSSIYVVYGILQSTGNDFFDWNNPYNSIIGTLGNPNFAAAFMAMLGIMCFSFIFNSKLSKIYRGLSILLFLGLSFNIYKSEARQGILVIFAGVALFISIYFIKKNLMAGIISFLFLIGIGVMSILGMLQIGPLENYLYKGTVTLRGYYWWAGIHMFMDKPITGVGIENYGPNFKLFRDPEYPLKYGFDLISTNAHNSFIQFFATGGLLLGITYLILTIYIAYRGYLGLKKLIGSEFILLAGLYAAWVGFQMQSLISIDNTGLTIWGWILGGLIVGISVRPEGDLDSSNSKNSKAKFNGRNSEPIALVASSLIVILVGVFVALLARAETGTILARNAYNPEIKNNSNNIKLLSERIINDPLAQATYKLEVANYLIQSGFETEGLINLEKLAKKAPKDPIFLRPLASMYEYKGRYPEAIEVRRTISIFDPQNVSNYLQLARLYRDTGNSEKSMEMKNLINKIAPISDEAKTVNQEIISK